MRIWMEFWISLAGLMAMLVVFVLYQAVALSQSYHEREEWMLPLLLFAVGMMTLMGMAAVGVVV